MKKHLKIGAPSATAINDVWQRDATAAAIAAVRDITKPGGVIPPGAPVGRLSDVELGWIVAAVLFGWIAKRAEQAAAEELDTERTVRMTGLDPDPWDAGAVAAILPDLGRIPDLDWSQPLNAWPRDMMVEFLMAALSLIRKAITARDLADGITRKSRAAKTAPEADFNDTLIGV
jgi:hypothetical protein